MDNQIVETKSGSQKAVMIFLAVVIALLLAAVVVYQIRQPEPYVREVLSLTGNPVQGGAIFQMNCAGCHGVQADGRVGPSLIDVSSRKSRVSIIDQVISGKTPPMPQFQPSPQEMADLLSYLGTL